MARPIDYNSKSEKIVWLTLKGYKPKQIAKILNMSNGSVRVLLWKRINKTSKMTANEDWNGVKRDDIKANRKFNRKNLQREPI